MYRWSVEQYDNEANVRPDYLYLAEKTKKTRANSITDEDEAYFPLTKKVPRLLASLSVVLFFILLVMAATISIIGWIQKTFITRHTVDVP